MFNKRKINKTFAITANKDRQALLKATKFMAFIILMES
jgi:hypothetical protein